MSRILQLSPSVLDNNSILIVTLSNPSNCNPVTALTAGDAKCVSILRVWGTGVSCHGPSGLTDPLDDGLFHFRGDTTSDLYKISKQNDMVACFSATIIH